jgi:hypothetical protein
MRRLVGFFLCLGYLIVFGASTNEANAQWTKYDSIQVLNSDEFYSFYPFSSNNLAYDPASNTLQLIYQAEKSSVPRLYWKTSTNGGTTWSTSPELDKGKGARLSATDIDLRPDLATSSDRTPFLVWNEQKYATKRAIFFTRDEGYGLGLWRAPKLLNDTNAAIIMNPNVKVSSDGQIVIVTWIGDGNIYLTRSTDGGTTFDTPRIVIDKTNALFPSLGGQQTLGRPTMAIGTGGYVMLIAGYWRDTRATWVPTYDYAPVYITSTDNGVTWGNPKKIAPPAGYLKAHNGANGFPTGGFVLLNNLPHFSWAWSKVGADSITVDDTSVRAFYGRMDAIGNVTWTKMSRDADLCLMPLTQGGFSTIGIDSHGWLFFLFEDLYPDGAPWGSLYARASKDGGQTWTPIVPISPMGAEVWIPKIAANVGTSLYWAGLKGGAWTGIASTAIVLGKVPVDSIFNYIPHPPGGTQDSALGYTYQDSDGPGGPSFKWVELKDKGVKIKNSEWKDAVAPDNPRDDGYVGPLSLGFSLPFFGKTRTSAWVGVNGAISLSGPNNFYAGFPLPGAPINDVVAVFWEDLYLDSAYSTPSLYGHGSVYYWQNTAKDTFIVEWYKIQTSKGVQDSLVTFEAIFAKQDSSFTFQYLNVGTAGAETSAVIGVQPDSGRLVGLKYVAGCPLDNIPHNGLAVKIRKGKPTYVTESSIEPVLFSLAQNYPNPFNLKNSSMLASGS